MNWAFIEMQLGRKRIATQTLDTRTLNYGYTNIDWIMSTELKATVPFVKLIFWIQPGCRHKTPKQKVTQKTLILKRSILQNPIIETPYWNYTDTFR